MFETGTNSQRGFIKGLLLDGKTITQKEGYEKYGICRVQARIHEIEKYDGLKIERRWIEVKTRYGKRKTKVVQYSLAKEKTAEAVSHSN
jgi:hypothetical protein